MNSSSIRYINLIRISSGIAVIAGIVLVLYLFFFYQSSVVIVQWNTESEIDTAGFNLYRSEFIDGPYERINRALILSSSDPYAGSSYSYNDADVIAGQTYYYKLEDVDKTGNTSVHGPIEVTAKRRNLWGYSLAALLVFGGLLGVFYTFRNPN